MAAAQKTYTLLELWRQRNANGNSVNSTLAQLGVFVGTEDNYFFPPVDKECFSVVVSSTKPDMEVVTWAPWGF